MSYAVNPRLEIIAEMSSDDYDMEVSTLKGFKRIHDINFGLKYEMAPDFSLTGKLMHGDAIGLSGVLLLTLGIVPIKVG